MPLVDFPIFLYLPNKSSWTEHQKVKAQNWVIDKAAQSANFLKK